VLNFNKHGGNRGNRHDLCRFPTIVLYRAVKVPSETAETIPAFIILNKSRQTGFPIPVSATSSTHSSQAQHIKMRACDVLCICIVGLSLYCSVTHCTGGEGVSIVIKCIHDNTLPAHSTIIVIADIAQRCFQNASSQAKSLLTFGTTIFNRAHLFCIKGTGGTQSTQPPSQSDWRGCATFSRVPI
jgi:hypothetical protein